MALTKTDKENIAIIVFGLALLLVSFAFDSYFANMFNSPALAYLFLWSSHAFVLIFLFLLVTTVVVWDDNKDLVIMLWLSFFSAVLISFVIKMFVKRERPISYNGVFFNKYSFPSIQASAVFSPLLILIKEKPVLCTLWLIFAILILLGRLYLHMHYISDILAGAILGLSVSYVMVILKRKYILF